MNTATKYFGDVSYEPGDVLSFPDGLFGFETDKKYLLIHFNENDASLLCLQNLDKPDLAFILMNPFCIRTDYKPELSKDDINALNLTPDSEVTFYAICVIRDRMEDSTINLKCPIVINPLSRIARQIILEDASLSFKHPLKPVSSSDGKEAADC